MISPANSIDALTAAGSSNYVRVAPTNLEQYAAMVTFAARLGKQRLFAVGDDAFWLQGGVDVPAARLGVRVIGVEDWAHSDLDASRLARRVKASDADAVLVDGSAGTDEGRTVRALRRALGPAVPMIAMEAVPVGDFAEPARPPANGIYIVSEAPPAAALTRRGQAWVLRLAAEQRPTPRRPTRRSLRRPLRLSSTPSRPLTARAAASSTPCARRR